MLLVIDIGNTNIKLGLYRGDTFIESWRLAVKVSRTADEYGSMMMSLFSTKGVSFSDIDGVIVSSVVPSLNYTIEHCCRYYMGITPMIVGPGIKTGLNIKYLNPSEVGSDRIVNCVAAYKLYKGPAIVVDFGTATTFSVVGEDGSFLGGMIAPGLKSSADALVANAAKLPRIELIKPEHAVCKTTIANMQAGVIYGFTGLVGYIIKKIKDETGFVNAKTVATGGLSQLLDDKSIIDVFDGALTLKGLKILYAMNVKQEDRK